MRRLCLWFLVAGWAAMFNLHGQPALAQADAPSVNRPTDVRMRSVQRPTRGQVYRVTVNLGDSVITENLLIENGRVVDTLSDAEAEALRGRPVPDTKASLQVLVPSPSATLAIEGQVMKETGTTRWYVSPPLDADAKYTYTVNAKWMEDGKEVSQEKSVPVTPGGQVTVSFLPAWKAE